MVRASRFTEDDAGQRLTTTIARAAATVGVIGQGQVGAMSARLAARVARRVIGFDRDPARVAEIKNADDDVCWEVVSEGRELEFADVIIIAVRASVDAGGNADLDPIRAAFALVRSLPERERLVVVETTLPPGTTRYLAAEGSFSASTHVAYSPERLRAGDSPETVLAIPRVVAGMTPAATNLACEFMTRVGFTVVRVSSPEVAELAKLLENAFLTTGISLISEMTRLAHSFGISGHEVAVAAATKPTGYLAFWPGAAIGGHCLPNDLELLRSAATHAAVSTPLLDGVAAAAGTMNATVIEFLRRQLAAINTSLEGARILLVGVGFKVGSADTSHTPAADIVRLLRTAGADVAYSDREIDHFEVDDLPVARIAVPLSSNPISAAVILAGNPDLGLDELDRLSRIVLDLGGARVMSGTATITRL